MKIDALVSQQIQPGLAIDASELPGLAKLREGDGLTGRVLFVGDDIVNVKTEEGVLLRAKLESFLDLQVGDKLELRVVGNSGDTVYLAVESGDEVILSAQAPATADGTGAQQAPLPPDVSAALELLSQLQYPPSRAAAEQMLQLVRQYPDLSMEEAAFLAANRIPAEEIPAARELLSGAVVADALLNELAETLQQNLPLLSLPQSIGDMPPEQAKLQVLAGLLGVETPELAEGETPIQNGQTPVAEQPTQAQQPTQTAQQPVQEQPVQQRPAQEQSIQQRPVQEQPAQQQPVQEQQAQARPVQMQQPQPEVARPTQQAVEPPPADAPGTEAVQRTAVPVAPDAPDMPRSGAETAEPLVRQTETMLRQLPELAQVPDKIIPRLAKALVSAVNELMPEPKQGAKMEMSLPRLVSGIFAEPGDGAELGGKLRAAREELGVRLAVLDSLTAATVGRGPTSAQVQRAAQHAEVLNRVDQFCYLQLPIRLEGQRKTAELYVYKRKKGPAGRIDPENATMLLALDMERLGRMEALVTIAGRSVSLKMSLGREEAIPYMRDMAPLLYKLMDEAGFRLTETRVDKLEKKTEPTTALSHGQRAAGDRVRGVDFTV